MRPFLSVFSLIHNVDGSTNGWTDQLMDRQMDGHILIDFKWPQLTEIDLNWPVLTVFDEDTDKKKSYRSTLWHIKKMYLSLFQFFDCHLGAHGGANNKWIYHLEVLGLPLEVQNRAVLTHAMRFYWNKLNFSQYFSILGTYKDP